MYKLRRRLVNKLFGNRKWFQFVIIFWLGACCVMMFTRNVVRVAHTKRFISNVTGSTTHNEAKVIDFKNREIKLSQKQMRETYNTIGGFLNRTKYDPAFLNQILDQSFLHKSSKEVLKSFLTGTKYTGFDAKINEDRPEKLQMNYSTDSDVIVFLHIQKTGGTQLNNRFLKQLQLPFKCACTKKLPCQCLSKNKTVWIYTSVYSGWPCGLHADWTQLHRCIPERIDKMEGQHRHRRYFYFTQLRNPLDRYLSEWRHQQGGHHWQDAILGCGDGFSDWQDIRPCFHGASWKGVSLDDFIGCPHNLATNRQARMLADLTLTNCYRNFGSLNLMKNRAISWIDSAIDNLKTMEYFGIMEEGVASDEMFRQTFGIRFTATNKLSKSGTNSLQITASQFKTIVRLVELDIHIYLFAKELFHKRYTATKNKT